MRSDFKKIFMELVNFFNLKGVKFDWRFTTEHGNHNTKLTFAGVDFGNSAFETLEWAIGDGDHFVKCVVNRVFWIFYAHAFLDFVNFLFGNWSWLGTSTNEAGDTWGITDNVPSFIRETHLNKDITLEDFTVDDFALAVFNLDLFFFWDDSIEDFTFEFSTIETLFDGFGDLIFVATVGAYGVPLEGVVITVYCHVIFLFLFPISINY